MGHSALQWLLRLCVDYHISSLLAENLAYHPLSGGLRSRGSQGVERELSPRGGPQTRAQHCHSFRGLISLENTFLL